MNDCPAQSQQRGLLLNCQSTPYLPMKPFEHYLPRPLGPYMLYLSLVSQFPLGPSLCHESLLRPGGRLLHPGGFLLCLLRRGDLLLRRGGFLFRPGGLRSRLLCPVGLQFRLLRPGGLLSRLLSPGGAPVLPVPPWWAPVPSATPWWAPVPPVPPWWAPVSSAPPWRAPVLSAPPWWAPVSSAPPWWASVSSIPPWFSALPALPRFLVLALPHEPGPLSLPKFHLRSTALLDCSKVGASGSRSLGGGALSRIWMPFHHMDSCTPPQTTFPIIHCTDHTHTPS